MYWVSEWMSMCMAVISFFTSFCFFVVKNHFFFVHLVLTMGMNHRNHSPAQNKEKTLYGWTKTLGQRKNKNGIGIYEFLIHFKFSLLQYKNPSSSNKSLIDFRVFLFFQKQIGSKKLTRSKFQSNWIELNQNLFPIEPSAAVYLSDIVNIEIFPPTPPSDYTL